MFLEIQKKPNLPDVRHPMNVHAMIVFWTIFKFFDDKLCKKLMECAVVKIFCVVSKILVLIGTDKTFKWMSNCEEGNKSSCMVSYLFAWVRFEWSMNFSEYDFPGS